MGTLTNRRILLGVTGGIAAYKSAELVRRLREAGADVRVVMTESACAFITPLTLQALCGHPVRQQLLDPLQEAAMEHIELARWADAVLIAPATADFMARLAAGLADDLLTTLCLATTAPLALAPAMNQAMWQAAVTQQNAERLLARGVQLLGPAEGAQACGETGPGRMLEPQALVSALSKQFATGPLSGLRVLVTAGPTREPIDPVRFVSNRSSGRMGFAVAEAAASAGAEVVLVAGPVTLPTPSGVERVDVETAAQMQAAVSARTCDIFIAVAAVADYRPVEAAPEKIKKSEPQLQLTLVRNPDILAEIGQRRTVFTVGFAAETEDLEANARAKRAAKGLDMVAANWVGERAGGHGFEADTNALHLYWEGGGCHLPAASKGELARALIERVAEHYRRVRDKP